MKKLNYIIVDDEPLAHEVLTDYCQKVSFLNPLGCFDDAFEALHFVQEQAVDLVFLDIQMPGLNGIQWLKSLRNPPQVIFTTAYDHYALEGYELNVVDYLMKPVPFERFMQAVHKLQAADPVPQNEQAPPSGSPEFVFVKTEYRIEKVILRDILYVEGMKDYLSFQLKNDRLLSLMNFRQAEELLPLNNFIRVHKSHMVALDKIESIERHRIRIGDKIIPIGETYKDKFYEKLRAGRFIL